MTYEEFRHAVASVSSCPVGTHPLLEALWHEAQGDWDRAHRIAQEVETVDGCRVHAYLHRREGDLDNARYWYRRAGVTECRDTLEREWESLARGLLGEPAR